MSSQEARGAGQTHLVGLDIDGTLLVTGHDPRPAVRESFQAARAAGHHLVLATGRSLVGALDAARLLKMRNGWIIASNGAVVARLTDAQAEVTEMHPIDAHAVVDYVSFVRPELCMATEDVGVGYRVWGPFPISELNGVQKSVSSLSDLWAEKTPRLAIYGPNAQSLVPSIRAGGMTAIRTRPDWVDVTPLEVSKATALENLRLELGVSEEATVAIGDGENDIPMLKWATQGVAMGHAPENVRFQARYRTKSVLEDGAALILRRLARIRTTAPMTL